MRFQRPHRCAAITVRFQEKEGEHGIERDDTNSTVVEIKEEAQRLLRIWSEKGDGQEDRERSILGARWIKLATKIWKKNRSRQGAQDDTIGF